MAVWAHDSSGISSLDAVVSTTSSHLTRTTIDQHIWAHSSMRFAATSAPNAFLSLSHVLILGLCKNQKMLHQALDHLPPHLLEVVFQNMARVWPPASLSQSTAPAPFALWLRTAALQPDGCPSVYDGLVLSDVEELQQINTLQAGSVTTLLDLATDKVTDETCLVIKNTVGKTVKALRISSPALTDVCVLPCCAPVYCTSYLTCGCLSAGAAQDDCKHTRLFPAAYMFQSLRVLADHRSRTARARQVPQSVFHRSARSSSDNTMDLGLKLSWQICAAPLALQRRSRRHPGLRHGRLLLRCLSIPPLQANVFSSDQTSL